MEWWVALVCYRVGLNDRKKTWKEMAYEEQIKVICKIRGWKPGWNGILRVSIKLACTWCIGELQDEFTWMWGCDGGEWGGCSRPKVTHNSSLKMVRSLTLWFSIVPNVGRKDLETHLVFPKISSWVTFSQSFYKISLFSLYFFVFRGVHA